MNINLLLGEKMNRERTGFNTKNVENRRCHVGRSSRVPEQPSENVLFKQLLPELSS